MLIGGGGGGPPFPASWTKPFGNIWAFAMFLGRVCGEQSKKQALGEACFDLGAGCGFNLFT